MVLAGVDAGEKMFVELTGEPDGAAPATVMKQINSATRAIASRLVGFCRCRIFHTKRAPSDAVWFGALKIGEHQCGGNSELPQRCYAVVSQNGRFKSLPFRDAFRWANPSQCD